VEKVFGWRWVIPIQRREWSGSRSFRGTRWSCGQTSAAHGSLCEGGISAGLSRDRCCLSRKPGQLEYDFAIAPHANPNKIRLAFRGIDGLALDDRGNLLLRADEHSIRQSTPTVYQVIEGMRREIASGYVLLGENEVGFELGPYNKEYLLMIDPVLTYTDAVEEINATLRME
jgi:hypothetical protein